MANVFGAIAHHNRTSNNPNYEKSLKETKQGAIIGQVISLAFLITTVVLILLGIASGSFTTALSITLISLPIDYFAYNIYTICGNLKKFTDSPIFYLPFQESMKNYLSERTCYFDCFIEGFINNCIANMMRKGILVNEGYYSL